MTIHLGNIPANSTLYIPFASYNSAGASVALTGLAATDIEIYKNGSVTQRSSDAGYALLDTDGIDFDSLTGINGFSIDLSDNTDTGFYSVGGFYWVVVSSVTIDSQTVNFIAATFRIVPAESSAGVPKVDVSHYGGSAGTFASGRPETNINSIAANAITATAIASDAITAAKIADGAIDAATFAAGAITATVIATGAIDADAIAADAITAAKVANDVGAEIAATVLTTQMTESYAANGVAPTLAQAVFALHQHAFDFSISGTSYTVNQLGGSSAFVLTLNDSDSPTAAERA